MSKSAKFQNYQRCVYMGNQNYAISGKTPSESLVGHDFSIMITLLYHLCQDIPAIRYIFYDLSPIFSSKDDIQNMKYVFWNIAMRGLSHERLSKKFIIHLNVNKIIFYQNNIILRVAKGTQIFQRKC